MTLQRIQVSDFRCLEAAQLELDADFTLISGPNAAGKTSILEAIYLLGRGRSFRTRRLDKLIRVGSPQFLVFGQVARAERVIGLGVEGSPQGVRAKLGGERVSSLAELASAFLVQIIDPEIHRLIEEGPSGRRRFLDWGVFHVEHGFLFQWQRYQQVLKQRNAALRLQQSRAAVAAWDGDLVRLGGLIDAARSGYVDRLTEQAEGLVGELIGKKLDLGYRRGWPRDLDFAQALDRSWSLDLATGSTQVGPQRAELTIRLDGALVKDRISRGQQKLLAAALLLAQLGSLPREVSVRPTLLLDDPAAELDIPHLGRLIQEVAHHSVQLVVTSLNPQFSAFGAPARHYRVESGRLSEQLG